MPGPAESPPTILLVDDHRATREELAFALGYDGCRCREAADGPTALRAIATEPDIDLVLLDVKLPGIDGLEVLRQMQEQRPELPVVMISGHGDVETAVIAVRRGAYDFLQKPFANDRVLLSIRNALATARLRQENRALRSALHGETLLGDSVGMVELRSRLERVAASDLPVLVTGENGTGKELVARQLHRQGARASGPFLARNCAAIPEDLAESELFGHEAGAFTGATDRRPGAFEQADRGTLFLDEVGDLPMALQPKLLRVLEAHSVVRLGGTKPVPVDVRVIAATHQDLPAMVAAKTFREDLFYRLHVVRLHVPALRERGNDVQQLARHFLQNACERQGRRIPALPDDAVEWLQNQAWPGNVRQLRNVCEAAAVLHDGETLRAVDLAAIAQPVPVRDASGATDWFRFATLDEFRAATEKEFLRRKLEENDGNIKRTAERIDLQRSNLYKKLERYGLK